MEKIRTEFMVDMKKEFKYRIEELPKSVNFIIVKIKEKIIIIKNKRNN